MSRRRDGDGTHRARHHRLGRRVVDNRRFFRRPFFRQQCVRVGASAVRVRVRRGGRHAVTRRNERTRFEVQVLTRLEEYEVCVFISFVYFDDE